jgi:ABC-type multidrug transport system ATPase subunit
MEPSIRSDRPSYSVPGREILRALSFEIQPRSFTVVVGENGAGRTTWLQLLMGIIEPTAGQVQVFGREPNWDPYCAAYSAFKTRLAIDSALFFVLKVATECSL